MKLKDWIKEMEDVWELKQAIEIIKHLAEEMEKIAHDDTSGPITAKLALKYVEEKLL